MLAFEVKNVVKYYENLYSYVEKFLFMQMNL